MDGEAGSKTEPYPVRFEERRNNDAALLDRELSRVHPDASAAAGEILAQISLIRRNMEHWRSAPEIIAHERTRITRTLGTRVARAVDALLVFRSVAAEPTSIAGPISHAWTPYATAVLDDRYVMNPVFTMEPLETRAGRVEWIHRSMRLYFCVGLYWCERTGVPRRWLLETKGRDRFRLAGYLAGEVGAIRPVYATHLPTLGPERHLTEEEFVHDHLEIARHMELEPHVRGLRSASWFYDPRVPAVSPHLAYIGSILDSGGCIRFELPTDRRAVEDALRTSQKRREAYEAGAYRPRVFGRLWSRDRFLRWAGAAAVDRMRGAKMSER